MADEKILIEMLQSQGETLKEIRADLQALALKVAENYVTEDKFNDYKKEQTTSLRWGLGFVFVVGGFIWSVVQWLIPGNRG